MTSHSPSLLRSLTGVALMLVAVLAAVGTDAPRLFSSAGPAASSAIKRPHGFKVRGNLTRPLTPGVSQPLNLRLTNRHRFSLAIKRLTVAVKVDSRHAAAGCRASSNFKLTRLSKRAYPIRLRPRGTRTLRSLRVRRLPRVAMRNLPSNQDACKGAKLKLEYAGRARRWRGGHAR